MIVGWGILVGLFYVFQRKLLYFPMGQPFGECAAMADLGAKSVQTNNLRFYLRSSEQAKGWLLLFHGNGGEACDRFYFLQLLQKTPLNIVINEYPGYGGSTETPSEKKFLQNALDLYDHIADLNKNETLPILGFGESLGSGVVTYLAAHRKLHGLILQTPYTSIAHVGSKHYPFLPIKWILKDSFQADQWVKNVHTPTLIYHGTDDKIIPFEIGQAQSKNFSNLKKFIEIPKAQHNNILSKSPGLFSKEILPFISNLL